MVPGEMTDKTFVFSQARYGNRELYPLSSKDTRKAEIHSFLCSTRFVKYRTQLLCPLARITTANSEVLE